MKKEETTLGQLNLVFPEEFDNEIGKETIPTITSKINEIKATEDFDPVERANTLSELYFQLALCYRMEGDKEKSVEAAIKTFEWSVFTFHTHPTLVEILLEQGNEECDKHAVAIANYHEFYFECRATEEEKSLSRKDEITSLLEQYSTTSKEAKWLLEDFALAPKAKAYFEGNLSISELLKYPKKWREEGRNPIECDKAETIFLDFANRTRELTSLWKNRDPSSLNDAIAFIRLIIAFIKKDIPLPNPLKIPEDIKDPVDYYEAIKEAEEYREPLYDKEETFSSDSLSDLIVITHGPKLGKINQVVSLLSKHAYNRCIDFLEDTQEERNGYIASYPYLNQIIEQHVYVLEDTAQFEEAFEIGSKMLDRFPTYELAFRTYCSALSIGKEKEAIEIIDNILAKPLLFRELEELERSQLTIKSLRLKANIEEIPKAEKFKLLDSFLRSNQTILTELALFLFDVDTHTIRAAFSTEEPFDTYLTLKRIEDDLVEVCKCLAIEDPESAPILQAIVLFATRNQPRNYHKLSEQYIFPKTFEHILHECDNYINASHAEHPFISYEDVLVAAGTQLFIQCYDYDRSIGDIIVNSPEENKCLLKSVSSTPSSQISIIDKAIEFFTRAKELRSSNQKKTTNQNSIDYSEKYTIRAGILAYECDYQMGLIYFLKGDYSTALEFFLESIQAVKKLGHISFATVNPFLSMAEFATARCYELIDPEKNYDKAIKHYSLALEALPTLLCAQKYYGEFAYSIRKEISSEEIEKAADNLFSYIKYQLNRDSEPDPIAELLGHRFDKKEENLTELAIKAAIMLKEAGKTEKAKNIMKFMLKQDKHNKKLRGLLSIL